MSVRSPQSLPGLRAGEPLKIQARKGFDIPGAIHNRPDMAAKAYLRATGGYACAPGACR